MKIKAAKKAIATNHKSNAQPMVLALPNTTESKMKAIVSLAAAIADLSKALNSTHTQIDISHCIFGAQVDGPTVDIRMS